MGVQEYINKRNQLAASRNPNGFADNSSQPTGSTTFVQNEKKDPSISLADYAKVPDIYEPESRYKERYDNFYNEVIGARDFGVETEEQRKKREHGDAIRLGFAGLTDGLSALANLYYTTKGAPSQQISGAGTNQLVKDLYNERMERDRNLQRFRDYTRAKADRNEERAYRDAFYKDQQDREEKRRNAQWKREDKIRREGWAREDQKRADERLYNEQQSGKNLKDRIALSDHETQNRIKIQNNEHANRMAYGDKFYDGNGGNRSGSRSGSTIRVPLGDSGKYVEFRKSDLTDPLFLTQIYHSLPEEKYGIREKKAKTDIDTQTRYYPIKENPSTSEMYSAIGKALSDGYLTEENMAPEIQLNRGSNNGEKPVDNEDVILWEPNSVESKEEIIDYVPGKAKPETKQEASSVTQETTVPAQSTKTEPQTYADTFTAKADEIAHEKALEQEAMKRRNEKAVKREGDRVSEAKKELHENLRKIQDFESKGWEEIKDSLQNKGLSAWQIYKLRLKYDNDSKDIQAMKRRNDTLQRIINKNY